MRWGKLGGAVLIVIGTILFIFDFLRMQHLILYLLTLLAFISPLLSGRKIAAYLHDYTLAKERGFKVNPSSLIYLWLFFWLFFLILYTIATILLSNTIKFLISTMKADYLGLIYNLLLFFGSFYLFKGIFIEKKVFLTLWGKALEKSKRIGKNVVKEAVERTKSFEKYL